MSEDSAPITITLKSGTDFSSPWIVVRGTNHDDVTNKLRSLGDVVAATIEAAELFKGAGNAAPILAPHPQAAAVQQQAPQQRGWGGQPQQQAAPPQNVGQRSGARPGDRPHPEGKQCQECGDVLVHKTPGSGKSTWRCPAWRWNNGNPNGHTQEWA